MSLALGIFGPTNQGRYVTCEYAHAVGDELCFVGPPLEDEEQYPDFAWRSISVVEDRTREARSWQFFHGLVTSEAVEKEGSMV